MYRLILMTLIALGLTGCVSGAQLTPTAPKRYPPPNLTAQCQALPDPASAKGTALLANHVAVARLYHECKDRHRGLAEWAANDGRSRARDRSD